MDRIPFIRAGRPALAASPFINSGKFESFPVPGYFKRYTASEIMMRHVATRTIDIVPIFAIWFAQLYFGFPMWWLFVLVPAWFAFRLWWFYRIAVHEGLFDR